MACTQLPSSVLAEGRKFELVLSVQPKRTKTQLAATVASEAKLSVPCATMQPATGGPTQLPSSSVAAATKAASAGSVQPRTA